MSNGNNHNIIITIMIIKIIIIITIIVSHSNNNNVIAGLPSVLLDFLLRLLLLASARAWPSANMYTYIYI